MRISFENILDSSDDTVELVRNWRNSKKISQYMLTNHYITKKEHAQWIKKLKTKTTEKTWIIKLKGRPLGVVSLSNINYRKKTANWGFYIADESYQGKGIGSVTLYRLMKYVFEALCFNRMNTWVLEDNTNAIKMYEKFGFKKEKNNIIQTERNGKMITFINMSISEDNWPCINRKFKNSYPITVGMLEG